MSELHKDSISSEKRFEKIFKLIPNPIYLFKRVENDLIFIDYNEAAKSSSEGKIDEYLGLKMLDLYPEHLDLIEELKNDVDIKGHLSRELKFKTKSTGIEKTVNTTWYKIPPNLIMVTMYDITTQRQVEDALQKSEREKSIIFENIPELIVFQDPDHSLIWANKAAGDSVGVDTDQLIGRKCYEIWHNRNNVCVNCPVDAALKSGQQAYTEITTPDGRIWEIRGYSVKDDNENIIGAIELTTEITERKKVEQKLIESEEKYRLISENANDLIAVLNDKYEHIFINEVTYLKVLGYSNEDMLGKTNFTLIHPEDLKASMKALKEGFKTSEGTIELRLRHKKGHYLWFEIYGKRFVDNKGNVRGLIISREITDRKKAEQKLKESEEKYRDLYEEAPNAYFTIGIYKSITRCNKAAERLLGYTVDEFLKMKVFDLYSKTDNGLVKAKQLFEQFKKGDNIQDEELQMRRKDGRNIWISLTVEPNLDKAGNVLESRSMVIDISKRKKAKEKIIKEREKAELYLNLVNVILVALDRNEMITLINRKGYEILEYKEGELIGKNWFDNFIKEEIREDVRSVFNQLMAEEVELVEYYENPILTKEGNEKIIAWHNTIIKDAQGKIIGTLSSGEDITERKKAEQELKEKNIELLALNRIIALGNESQSLQEFLEKSYDQVLDIVGFDRGGVYLYDPETQHNILILHKNVHPDFIAAVKDVDISEGIFSRVFDKNNPFYIEDFSEFMEGSKELGVYSAVIVPLRSKDEYVGSMNVASSVHHLHSQNELELLVAIGKQMGIVIQKFESETLLKQSEEKYREAYNRSDLYKDIFTHDINNILQNILTSTELSKLYSKDPTQSEKFKVVSNLISEQIIRGRKLVSNVQKLSEVEEIKTPIASMEASNILSKAIDFVKESYPYRDINIELKSFQNQFFVNANELLVNIFENILFNAVKHNTSQNIEILVRISKDNKNGKNFIKFEFLDNGVGIPNQMKTEVFSRKLKEYKRDNVPSGIGLGLLLVNRILESYNGEIKVEDRILGDYSKGSNFIILIPEAG